MPLTRSFIRAPAFDARRRTHHPPVRGPGGFFDAAAFGGLDFVALAVVFFAAAVVRPDRFRAAAALVAVLILAVARGIFPLATAPLNTAPGRNTGTSPGATSTGEPVRGWRAVRAARARRSKVPKPGILTDSPRATANWISERIASSADAATFRSPSRIDSALMSSALFTEDLRSRLRCSLVNRMRPARADRNCERRPELRTPAGIANAGRNCERRPEMRTVARGNSIPIGLPPQDTS